MTDLIQSSEDSADGAEGRSGPTMDDSSPELNEARRAESFSIYNNQLDRRCHNNVLRFLEPADKEHGWHVARNLLKPLNHLSFLRRQESIATTLNLHNMNTPAATFDRNYDLLGRHQSRELSTGDLISLLAAQLSAPERPFDSDRVRSLLRKYSTVRHMEFHPTDFCNLTCKGCTYGHDDQGTKPPPISFPFDEIAKVSALGPRSIVVVGGGEPTLYRYGRARYQDVVDVLTSSNPGVTLGLSTNGTHKPEGDWPDRFDWIRVSLDAATADTYAKFRGKHQFETAVHNFLRYLDHRVPYVGISFVFGRSNVHEYASVAKFVYDLVREVKPWALPRVNVQYRPLRRDPHNYGRPFNEAVRPEEIARASNEVVQLAQSSPDMERFLREQTNVTAIMGGNSHPPHEFSRCYYSQTFRIVRASGELRPCFIRIAEPDFILGNIRTDRLESIALNALYIGARRKPHCDAFGCRQCHINYTFEKGLSGEMLPSSSPAVLADPMY